MPKIVSQGESPAQAVQIGDPITQKMMTDMLLEARDQGLYRAITDNGAGGLSSSVGEMAELVGGAELDLVLERGQARIAVEAKVSTAPVPTKGFWTSLEDLEISQAYIVAPVKEAYPIAAGVAVLPLSDLLTWADRIAAGQPHPATGY